MRDAASGYVREEAWRIDGSDERFDRVAFAMRALRVLRPHGMTVAVREGRTEVRVERGRDWSAAPGASWAVVSVPPDASREAIAMAMAGLVGLDRSPLALALLIDGSAEPH